MFLRIHTLGNNSWSSIKNGQVWGTWPIVHKCTYLNSREFPILLYLQQQSTNHPYFWKLSKQVLWNLCTFSTCVLELTSTFVLELTSCRARVLLVVVKTIMAIFSTFHHFFKQSSQSLCTCVLAWQSSQSWCTCALTTSRNSQLYNTINATQIIWSEFFCGYFS